MKSKHVILTLATLMLLAATPQASAITLPTNGAACGGVAPVIVDCSSTAVLGATLTISIAVTIGFVGDVSASVSTATGSASVDCFVLAALMDCSPLQQSGILFVGQGYTLSGGTSTTAIGEWEVSTTAGRSTAFQAVDVVVEVLQG